MSLRKVKNLKKRQDSPCQREGCVSSAELELHGVTRAYSPGVAALDALDLTIKEGERLAVLGPSGSGKTTLLRLIAGLETPDAGTIRIKGRDTRGVPPHQRDVAMVFQNPALYPHLNVMKNLAFGLKARGVGRRDRQARAGEIAEMLGLGRLLERKPDELSGGERQRVALGRAVARKPRVLLLDEPFSNLDEPLRAALRAELIALHQRFGSTLVHVTHDQAEALILGDRVAVLDQGRLMQLDTAEDVYHQPAHRFVARFVGSPGMNLIEFDAVLEENIFRITTPDGVHSTRYKVRANQDDDLLPRDAPRRLELGIRPPWVIISSQEHVDSTDACSPFLPLPAIVRRSEFRGLSQLVTVDVDGQKIVAEAAGLSKFSEGQHVVAHLALLRASWFDPATGRRLELDCQPLADSIA
jgi:multiple sugar transport system ATP-binding protein